jgi:hypothetical protein
VFINVLFDKQKKVSFLFFVCKAPRSFPDGSMLQQEHSELPSHDQKLNDDTATWVHHCDLAMPVQHQDSRLIFVPKINQ